jgi:hypothetical protein
MVCVPHHIADAKERKPDAGAASIINNATRPRNKRYGTIAATREVCNATCHLGNGLCLSLRLRVQGSARAVGAVQNTRVFQTETRVVADGTFLTICFSSEDSVATIPKVTYHDEVSQTLRLMVDQTRNCLHFV